MKGFKENVSAQGLNLEVRANKNIPYTIFVYQPFILSNFSDETKAYLKRYGINFQYIKNSEDLKEKILKLKG